jgi:hypothetical protein
MFLFDIRVCSHATLNSIHCIYTAWTPIMIMARFRTNAIRCKELTDTCRSGVKLYSVHRKDSEISEREMFVEKYWIFGQEPTRKKVDIVVFDRACAKLPPLRSSSNVTVVYFGDDLLRYIGERVRCVMRI